MKTFEEWLQENEKYIVENDCFAWLEQCWVQATESMQAKLDDNDKELEALRELAQHLAGCNWGSWEIEDLYNMYGLDDEGKYIKPEISAKLLTGDK
jgi:hypothetical protein